jgi:hypothetical protein
MQESNVGPKFFSSNTYCRLVGMGGENDVFVSTTPVSTLYQTMAGKFRQKTWIFAEMKIRHIRFNPFYE